jgi:hypothetical protein
MRNQYLLGSESRRDVSSVPAAWAWRAAGCREMEPGTVHRAVLRVRRLWGY